MKKVFTFYKNSQKGQDLVEYALMLAIIIGIGWGIYSQTGVADSIKNVFGNASSLMETAKKNTGTFNIDPVLKHFDEMQKKYHSGEWFDYKRGLFSSVWLNPEDAADDQVKSLASELGATMWTYYNGQKGGLESGVLYWTTEKDFDSAELTYEGKGWSKQNVLSYRYDPKDKTYSVIENRVWLKQPGYDGKNHNGLAQLHDGEYGKPKGNVLGSYSTYEAAQQRYNEVKTAQKGYIYTGTAQTK